MPDERPMGEKQSAAKLFTTRRVMNGAAPRSVRRDAAGNWHVHERENPCEQGVVETTLDALIRIHVSITDVLALPLGWTAVRGESGEWTQSPSSTES